MLLGLRGTRKTVLLNEIGRNAEQEGLLVSRIEAPEGESLSVRQESDHAHRRVARASALLLALRHQHTS